jgi:hypothetical protein
VQFWGSEAHGKFYFALNGRSHFSSQNIIRQFLCVHRYLHPCPSSSRIRERSLRRGSCCQSPTIPVFANRGSVSVGRKGSLHPRRLVNRHLFVFTRVDVTFVSSVQSQEISVTVDVNHLTAPDIIQGKIEVLQTTSSYVYCSLVTDLLMLRTRVSMIS